MKVTQLNIYPIKSTAPYRVEQGYVEPKGFNFDREFMLAEADGKFISARKDAVLYQLNVLPVSTGIVICHTSGQKCTAFYKDFVKEQKSEVWGARFDSLVAADNVNLWLSNLVGREVRLHWLGAESRRRVMNFAQQPLSFADSNPVSLMSEKSLAQVQAWSPIEISMARFRPNIVIDGMSAFEEENWQRIKIGEVVFVKSELCTRCIMITRNLETLELDSNAEPFRTLKKKHANEKGKPVFGIHLIPQNSGVIRVGDDILVEA